jgi:muramidase (phage lysozyme)
LLDFIGGIEAPKGYGTVYGNNQDKLPKPLTSMTLDEVLKAQSSWTKRFGSSASGRYQFMKATLSGLKKELGLSGTIKLNAQLQDRLGYHLLKRRGYAAFMAGSINTVEFAKQLAMEWASLPVLKATKGQKRQVSRGQSYYAGDGLNKSLVSPEKVEGALGRASNAKAMPQPDNIETEKVAGMVRLGTGGARIREVQELLHRDGFAVAVDGVFGPSTRDAVRAFQKKHNLKVDGLVGPATWEVLNRRRVDEKETPGAIGPAEAITQTPEGRQGTATAITAGSVTAAIDPAKDALYPVVGSGGWIDTIYTILTIVGVALTLGGIAWIAYGWLKARRTTGVKVIA